MATRKKKSAPSSQTKSGTSRMYVEGTPTDSNGGVLEDVVISRAKARRIPVDAESARVAQQHKETMGRKSQGEVGIRWNSDFRIRYGQCISMHPHTRVSIKQVEPYEDDNITARSASALGDYDKLIGYIRDSHWKGERATYKWVIYDDTQPQWATGLVRFNADAQWSARKSGDLQQEPENMSHHPPWPPGGSTPFGFPQQAPPAPAAPYPYPPHGGGIYPAPVVGYPAYPQGPPAFAQAPPQTASYPPSEQSAGAAVLQEPLEQVAPPVASQGAPAPEPPIPPMPPPMAPAGGASDTVINSLIEQLQHSTRENAMLREDVRRQQFMPPQAPPPQAPPPPTPQATPQREQTQPGYWEWWAWQQAQQAQQAEQARQAHANQVPVQPTQPPKQEAQEKSPVEQARDTITMLSELSNIGSKFVQQMNPAAVAAQEAAKEDPFPVQVKEIGPIRAVAIKGELMHDAVTMGMFNADKIGGAAKSLIKEFRGVLDDRQKAVDSHQHVRENKIRDVERLAAAAERLKAAHAPVSFPPQALPPSPSSPVVPSAAPAATPPAPAPLVVQSPAAPPVSAPAPASPPTPARAVSPPTPVITVEAPLGATSPATVVPPATPSQTSPRETPPAGIAVKATTQVLDTQGESAEDKKEQEPARPSA